MEEEKSCLSQKTNGAAHLYSDSNYAHFSRITEHNKHLFPDFAKASPQKFILHPGDVLFIPSKWWHWVKSFGSRSISINFWFDRIPPSTLNILSESKATDPRVFKDAVKEWPALTKWTNEYLSEVSEKCVPGGVWIWRDSFSLKERISMSEFIEQYASNKDEFAYLITLKDYEHKDSPSNTRLLDALDTDIWFPRIPDTNPRNSNDDSTEDVESNRDIQYGHNFWMNFGGIDTGLHYDDQHGFLCVVDGTKEVTLYPPTDSIYLYPYPNDRIELSKADQRRFMCNLYKDLGPVEPCRLNSVEMLEITLETAPALAEYTKKMQAVFGPGNIVYGIKNDNGIIRWEYYFYGIDRLCSTYQNRNKLFKTRAYNSHMTMDRILKFHTDLYASDPEKKRENDKILSAARRINRAGLTVFSLDFDEETALSGKLEKLNLYYTMVDEIEVPFVLKEDTFTFDGETLIKSIQYIARYDQVFTDTDSFTEKFRKVGLTDGDIFTLFRFCSGSPYKCKTVSLVNKREEMGIYFFGISPDAFLKFLLEYKYPPRLVEMVASNYDDLKSMELEVGFHFLKGIGMPLPTRTAFYGLF
jgi:hypothetical protein